MWRCQTWKCQTVPTHHPKPFFILSIRVCTHVCLCACSAAACVQCVCPWAAVTSKQQSFEMTGPSDDSSATATGQVRDRSLSPSNTPSLSPSVPRLPSCSIPLYFSLPLSFVLWLPVTGLVGFLLFIPCGFLAATSLRFSQQFQKYWLWAASGCL